MFYRDLEDVKLHDKKLILVPIKDWEFAIKCRDKLMNERTRI